MKPKVSRNRAAPGKIRYIGSTRAHCTASEMDRPHEGVGGFMPTPRNDRPASAPMRPGIDSVMLTMSSGMRFGRI